MAETKYTDRRAPVRLARVLASPVGVLVTLPLLVIAVGIGIMLVGRDATQSSAPASSIDTVNGGSSLFEHTMSGASDRARSSTTTSAASTSPPGSTTIAA